MQNTHSPTKFNPAMFEKERENPFISILMIAVIVLMGAVLLLVTLCQLCIIDGSSMENTYLHTDSVLIRKTTNISHGEVIVLDAVDPKSNVQIRLIKRAIALGGDTFMFSCDEDKIYHVSLKNDDGEFKALDEPYIKEPMNKFVSTFFALDTEYTLKADEILFLGDNRNNSNDARYYGIVKKSALVGKEIYSPKKSSFEDRLLRLIYPDPEKTLLERIKNFFVVS